MRKIREVLRLQSIAQLSDRQIASCVGMARSTISEYLRRAKDAGLLWPLPEDLDDAAINEMLFPAVPRTSEDRAMPDWSHIKSELSRKGVTLMLLWQEYKAADPHGYKYSYFCQLYRKWRGELDLVMRQNHKAGERLFVDYSGMTVPIVDPASGESYQAEVFVATFGASNYTYAEATRTQDMQDWIASHQRAFRFFGGVPEILVPDNLKSGVDKAHRYDPEINRTYTEMAQHYGVAVMPARVATPRDKPKVESGVHVVEQWILAPMRDRQFFSLAELNAVIAKSLIQLNDHPFQKLPGSRRSTFEQVDRPALGPLPPTLYSFGQWKKVRVNIDYHIEVDGHYYSVPYKYARQQLDARLSQTTVECFHGSRRIASHLRSFSKGQHTTLTEHMTRAHREYAEWTPERITRWAASSGPCTAELARRIIESRDHREQGYRTCLGILRLGKAYSAERLEAAAERALAIGTLNYKSIESILKNRLDMQPLPSTPQLDAEASSTPIEHENIRGSLYYSLNTLNGDTNQCC